MKDSEKDWFLSLPKDIKLKLMSEMLEEGQTGMAFATMKILLDAPITQGGISTDEISEVMDAGIANMKSIVK